MSIKSKLSFLGSKYKILLVIFPALYLFIGFYFRQIFGDLSLRSTDPDYLHFLSGMCISTGQFSQANIDHPGSALQLILAFVFRLTYFFRGGSQPYFEDAIINSDMYLSIGNLVITVLLAVSILWAGYKTFKITKNLFYSILIQTSPFLMDIWYAIIGRIYPELLILIPIVIIQVQLLKEIYSDKPNSTKDILTYSFAIAFGLSLKMTFLPLAFIPLVTIRSIKGKLQFAAICCLMFLAISLPVTFQLERFWNWMKGIFMHSGAYQGGDSNIVDWTQFKTNLHKIFVTQKQIFIATFLLASGTIALLFKNAQKKKKEILYVNVGLLVAILGITFIISKQFAERYFVPAMLFFPFLLILNLEIIRQYLPQKAITITLSAIVGLIILMNLKNELPTSRYTSDGIQQQMQARIKSRDFVNTLPENSYKIIVSQDYGCPFHEYAIMYSFCVAGSGWPNHNEKLNKIYPDTYFYFTWDNTIKYWGNQFDPIEVINSGKPVYLYLEKNTDELYQKTISKLDPNSTIEFSKNTIFVNKKNHEAIYQLTLKEKKGN